MQAMNLNPTIASALMIPQLATTAGQGIDTLLRGTVADKYKNPDGSVNIEKFLQEKGSQTVAIAGGTINQLAKKLGETIKNIL